MTPLTFSAFQDELQKIASAHGRMKIPKERKGRRPMTVETLLRKEKDGTLFKDASFSFLDELTKIAATRSVQEWRALNAAGNQGGADAIAKAHAQLGAKPRYLEDISLGGAEAGVDKMMGSAGQAPAAAPGLQQRLQQYQQNKAQLGVAGRTPTQSVRQSPGGREALLRGTQGPAAAVAPNESGYAARKLYKPDSQISRGEFTPQLLEQKQHITDQARALSPEAKSMVPAMYGHQTMGQGGLQRTTSMHEYVPGLSDIRGTSVRVRRAGVEAEPKWTRAAQSRADLTNIKQKVIDPMQVKGMTVADTISRTGVNYGNVVNSPAGPKVLDFLPDIEGQKNPALESLRKYMPQNSQFVEGGAQGSVGQLRKEVFNPKMDIAPATLQQRLDAERRHLGVRAAAPVQSPAQEMATARPGTAPMPVASTPTAAVARPLSTSGVQPTARGLGPAPAIPARASNLVHLPTARPTARMVGRLEGAAAKTAPGLLRRAGTLLGHL